MRPQLPIEQVAPEATKAMQSFHLDVVSAVKDAIAKHPIVVVGMAQNPFVKRTRKALTDAGFSFEYLEYGSYVSEWRKRLAIKMWSGWPTFPQVFVHGTLIGGFDLTAAAIADGSLKKLVEAPRTTTN